MASPGGSLPPTSLKRFADAVPVSVSGALSVWISVIGSSFAIFREMLSPHGSRPPKEVSGKPSLMTEKLHVVGWAIQVAGSSPRPNASVQ